MPGTDYGFLGSDTHALGHVSGIAILRQGLGVPSPSTFRTFDRYGFMLVLKGEGLYKDAGGCEEALRAGSLVFVFPGKPHYYGPSPGTRWDELFAIFEGPLFELLHRIQVIDEHQPVLNLGDPLPWHKKLGEVLAEFKGSPLALASHVQALIAEMVEASTRHESAREAWLSEAKARLSSRLEMPADLQALARSLGMSYESFRRRFREETGKAPYAFRMEAKLQASSDLLRMSGMSQSEIARRLGFSDEFHFSAAFKRSFGVSPSAFRAGRAASL